MTTTKGECMRRTYNDSERWLLYKQSSGKCQMCSKELWGVFEVDHIKPFSKGGPTTLDNAQVLCVECNRRKGNLYHNLSQFPYELRKWQERAHAAWLNGDTNVLVSATPGAGKTLFALMIAHEELSTGKADQILIVVPTDSLRDQWAIEAAPVGINLSTNYDARFDLAADYHGVITTYQTIAERDNSPKSLQRYTAKKRTLIILDEVHHVGETLAWSNALANVGAPCYRRLLVTGTPFRSDRHRIPYVSYRENEDGGLTCKPDYEYGYGHAVRDGVVRHVYFQTFDGDVSWFTPDGELVNATFQDELPSEQDAIRLRHALDHRGQWLVTVLQEANKTLDSMRTDDPRAAGLVVAKDIAHAREIARLLDVITGEHPILVTSKPEENFPTNESPNDIIDEFRYSTGKWIVAVKMISEGVDIKRLRIGVWATNITTELFFRQVVGRIVRMDRDGIEGQWAYQYIPKLSPITEYAETIKAEKVHNTDDLDTYQDEIEKLRNEIDAEAAAQSSIFNNSNGYKSTVIIDNFKVEQEDLAQVYSLAASASVSITDHEAVKFSAILKLQKTSQTSSATVETTTTRTNKRQQTMEERKEELRRKRGPISRAVAQLIEISNGRLDFHEVHRSLNHAQGVRKVDECTLDQLNQRIKVIKAWQEAFKDDGWRSFAPKRYIREHLS